MKKRPGTILREKISIKVVEMTSDPAMCREKDA